MIGDLDQTWRGLEVRHLVALEAVARAGTFRGAARELGYSQSALSDQIAGLERLLGRRLVERPRGSRSVRINPAGALVLGSIDGISSRLAVLQADLRALDTERTTLRVGIYQTASTRLLPRALPLLRRDHPEVDVTLDEAPDDGELLRRLGRGDLDVAFAGRPVADDSLVVRDLLDDPYLALVPADSAFAAEPFLPLRTLLDEPLIDHRSARPSYHVSARVPGGFRPRNVVFRTDDTSTVHALVAAGIGIALLPRLGIDEHDPRVRAVPVEPPLAPRQLVLAWLPGSGREAAIEAFAAAVIAAAEERVGPEPGL